MSTIAIAESKELTGVAKDTELAGVADDILGLLEMALNAPHYSGRVRPRNSGQLAPQFVRFFSWIILVAELKAATNECPEILQDHQHIKSGIVTTRNWSWRMVLEEALQQLAVSDATCFAQSIFWDRQFIYLSIADENGQVASTSDMSPEDLIQAVGLKALLQISALGLEGSRCDSTPFPVSILPTEITFVGNEQHWQAVKDAIIAASK